MAIERLEREVILDLLPLYLAGEASSATRALVEEYLRGDPELAARVREQAAGLAPPPPRGLAPELELRALRRTRRQLALLRWLFAIGLSFVLVSLSFEIRFQGGRPSEAHFLMRDFPGLAVLLACGLASLTGYFLLRRRLRRTGL